MISLKSNIDLIALHDAIERNIHTWKVDDGNVHMANSQGAGIPEWLPAMCLAAVGEIEELTGLKAFSVMINRLERGKASPVHQDRLQSPLQGDNAKIVRFHLPVLTNDVGVYWWDEYNGECIFPMKHWTGPVPYWQKHKVWYSEQFGYQPYREHFIVDLDCTISQAEMLEEVLRANHTIILTPCHLEEQPS